MDVFDLLDWKRRIFELYAEIRSGPDLAEAWLRWREVRDELFRLHPQSPLPEEARVGFDGVRYFPYDRELRVLAEVEPAVSESLEIAGSAGSAVRFTRFGLAGFELAGERRSLELYWLRGVRRRHLRPLRRRDQRRRVLRPGPVCARLGQGCGPGYEGRPARPRLQLRLQPELLV